ncbi:MAG: ATP-grasp domain-containing protein, partial [Alphaproteobacteria bacterium]
MFEKILIANRGEIARRVIRSCRRLGIRTVAVFSEADRNASHVREADEAVMIGPAPAADSYLKAEAILDAARRTGADAIHPGYGFLSENVAFARACADAGIVFIGPPPQAMEAMAEKDTAKRLMAEAGVPVVPGYQGDDLSDARLEKEAAAIGFPVLIKAVAGGGGKGMRRVDRPEEFGEALAAARREAKAAFGNDRVLIEKFVTCPRHVEVQVIGDADGRVVALYERDCSVQRRHQKILEEAPAPVLPEILRRRMMAAAERGAAAIGYTNAGTMEFILDAGAPLGDDTPFFFMEMNTRLQVEHPVTEMVTGLDLVAWQIRIAAGESLPADWPPPLNGHAIEARLYAEDPARGFLPQTGRLVHFRLPPAGGGLRFDLGVAEGDEVGVHYDPMIGKLIAHGRNREEARRLLLAALNDCEIVGLVTNRDFLRRVLAHPDFTAGRFDTGFVAAHEDELTAAGTPEDASHELLALAALGLPVLRALRTEEMTVADEELVVPDPFSPWDRRDAWRLNLPAREQVELTDPTGTLHRLVLTRTADGIMVEVDGAGTLHAVWLEVGAAGDFAVLLDGVMRRARIVELGDSLHLFAAGAHHVFTRLHRRFD